MKWIKIQKFYTFTTSDGGKTRVTAVIKLKTENMSSEKGITGATSAVYKVKIKNNLNSLGDKLEY